MYFHETYEFADPFIRHSIEVIVEDDFHVRAVRTTVWKKDNELAREDVAVNVAVDLFELLEEDGHKTHDIGDGARAIALPGMGNLVFVAIYPSKAGGFEGRFYSAYDTSESIRTEIKGLMIDGTLPANVTSLRDVLVHVSEDRLTGSFAEDDPHFPARLVLDNAMAIVSDWLHTSAKTQEAAK